MHSIVFAHYLLHSFPAFQPEHVKVVRKILKAFTVDPPYGEVPGTTHPLSKADVQWAVRNSASVGMIAARLHIDLKNESLATSEPMSEVAMARANSALVYAKVLFWINNKLSAKQLDECRTTASAGLKYLSLQLSELHINHKACQLAVRRQRRRMLCLMTSTTCTTKSSANGLAARPTQSFPTPSLESGLSSLLLNLSGLSPERLVMIQESNALPCLEFEPGVSGSLDSVAPIDVECLAMVKENCFIRLYTSPTYEGYEGKGARLSSGWVRAADKLQAVVIAKKIREASGHWGYKVISGLRGSTGHPNMFIQYDTRILLTPTFKPGNLIMPARNHNRTLICTPTVEVLRILRD
ncbi:hypothetical protein BDV93DRAFT_511995 [Ceratobasidium sp. AG-I]|nr:hypothetical protein BDV93DRAFT_511995 [Ceratobasidium sp. AG-I]